MPINILRRLFKKETPPLAIFPGQQDSPPPQNRMVILGNAPMKFDMTQYVDASALVVRFNECGNYAKGTGTKADILCLNNFGKPAEQWITRKTIQKLPFISSVDEIWIPRVADILLTHRIAYKELTGDRHFDKDKFRDLSNELISSNGLGEKKIVRFSEELNKEVLDNLKSLSPVDFREPSTGILAISHVLSEGRFSGYDKIILGFTFEGWKGHPWSGELLLVKKYMEERSNLMLL
ncbi:MAG: hypothetical protein PHD19_03285 [Dechloromonas sp.]|nr:hypothetical protein [Dechloromonas sp.]